MLIFLLYGTKIFHAHEVVPGTCKLVVSSLSLSLSLSDKSNTAKFKEWIDFPSLTSFKLSHQLVELFGYMAYEIVQRVRDNVQCIGKEDLRAE